MGSGFAAPLGVRMTVSSFTPSRIGIITRVTRSGGAMGSAGAAVARAVGAAVAGGLGAAGGSGRSGGAAPAQERRRIEETRSEARRIGRDYTHWTNLDTARRRSYATAHEGSRPRGREEDHRPYRRRRAHARPAGRARALQGVRHLRDRRSHLGRRLLPDLP